MTAPGYKIGPLTTYADAGEMRRLFADMPVGGELIYATGPFLGDNPAPVLAREWAARGRAQLFQRRHESRAHCFHYIARKADPAHAQAVRPVVGECAAIPFDWPDSEEGRMFDLLQRLADEKRECPTNAHLARALGLKDEEAARYRFNKLVSWGHVRVIEPQRFGPRVIEIAATGRRTKEAIVERRRAGAVAGRARP